jgi:hypothetical protein
MLYSFCRKIWRRHNDIEFKNLNYKFHNLHVVPAAEAVNIKLHDTFDT